MENDKKSEEVRLIKGRTVEEIRAWVRKQHSAIEPDQILLALADLEASNPEALDDVGKAVLMLGHERHYLVAEAVFDERWRPMIMDLAQSIQSEYRCVTASEIALAGLAASAYYRSLRAARKMNALLEKMEISVVGVNLMAQASKEIDRANRQYASIIEILRARKQPQLDVKIHAKTAFFNEHQTINYPPQNHVENNAHQ